MNNKDNIIQREAQRAQEEVAVHSSFIRSKYNLYVFAQILLIGGMIISAATEGWHLQTKFDSLFLAIVGVVLIESISVIMGNMVVNDVRNGIMSAGNIARFMFAFQFLLYAGATYFSVSLTLEGAPDYYEHSKSQTAPPTLVSKDSINAVYAASIADIDQRIDEQEGTRWKGTITTQANENIAQLLELKASKEETRDAALADAQARNDDSVAQWNSDIGEDQKVVMGFAGIGEIVKIFSLIFIALYKQGRNQELGIHAVERKLGVDIDGDGIVGKPGRSIGYKTAAAAAERNEATAMPKPSPRSPIGASLMPWLGEPTQDPTATPDTPAPDNVATRSYNDLSEESVQVELEAWYNHYKQHRSQQKAVESNTGYTEKGRARKCAEHQKHMQEALSRLERHGHTIQETPKERRTLLELVKL